MAKKLHEDRNGFSNFVCLIIFLTNIGQTPYLIDNYQTRIIVIPIWLVFAIVCLIKNHVVYLGESKSFWILAIFWTALYFIGFFFINDYGASDLPYTIFLSFFIFLVGLIAGSCLYSHDIEKIVTAFIISAMIVCFDTFVTYIYGTSLVGRIYAYDSKNSVSQILLTAWILILIFKFQKELRLWKKAIYAGSFILLTVTLIGLKSRATLIAIPVVLIWLISHGNLDKRLRNVIVTALLIIVIFFMANPAYMDTLIYDVILGGRNVNSLNDVSSGRAKEWQTFFMDFSDKPFFGHGRMKRESLILTSLLEFGILGGGLILLIAFWPVYWSIRYCKKNRFYLMFSSIAITYCLNGVFEQLAPFGPGVKCYFLWFVMGALISKTYFNETKLEEIEFER